MEKFPKFISHFKKPPKLALILMVFLIIIAFVWRIFISNKTTKPQYQKALVERETLVSSISASGRVLTSNIINVTTGASGVVKISYVKDGDEVAAGQKVGEVSLDAQGQKNYTSAWSAYLSAKNSLEAASATQYTLQTEMFTKWDKFKKLAESSTYQNSDSTPNYLNRALPEFHIAQKEWLAAESKYKNQQAVIEQAKASLNNSWISYQLASPFITAPMAGTINNVGLFAGMVLDQTTNPNQRVAVIQNEANPLLAFNLTEIDIPKIAVGQKATVTLDSLQGKTFTGKIITIDKIGTITNNVTNYPAIVELDTASSEILPNMSASVGIIVETKNNALSVPSTAIQTQGEESFVKILKSGQEQQVPVQIGISSDTKTEIISGLSEGDEVIIGTVVNTGNGQRGTPFGGGGFGGGGQRR